MFHQHIKTDVEGFRKTIDSPQCTACMLMQHKDTAHAIICRAGVTHVSLDKAFELKQRIIKHKPHLKRAMNELLPAEDRKSRSKRSLGVVGSIIFAIGTLLALTGLEAATQQPREAYQQKVSKLPSLNVPNETHFAPWDGQGNPADHVRQQCQIAKDADAKLCKDAIDASDTRRDLKLENRATYPMNGALAQAFDLSRGGTHGADFYINKYAKRFKGNVREVLIKVGRPINTNEAATSFYQYGVKIGFTAVGIALAAGTWYVMLVGTDEKGDEVVLDKVEHIKDEETAFTYVDRMN